jgi:hypothetical protein
MTEFISVNLFESNGSRRTANLELTTGDRNIITFRDGEGDSKLYEAVDLFEALRALRIDLAKEGIIIACNGSRKNVYPSGMGRSMSAGRMSYVMRIGHATEVKDLVDIFDPASREEVSSVEEQSKFYSEWIKSFRR